MLRWLWSFNTVRIVWKGKSTVLIACAVMRSYRVPLFFSSRLIGVRVSFSSVDPKLASNQPKRASRLQGSHSPLYGSSFLPKRESLLLPIGESFFLRMVQKFQRLFEESAVVERLPTDAFALLELV